MKIFSFIRKFLYYSIFNYILIVFVSLSLYLWKLPQKSSNFTLFLWISIILWDILNKIIHLSENTSNSFFFFSIFCVHIPKAFPFPNSPFTICLISPLPSAHSLITPHFSVLILSYKTVPSLFRTMVLSFLLGNLLIC